MIKKLKAHFVKYPFLKRIILKYLRILYRISRPIKLSKDLEYFISIEIKGEETFFGYYDISPINENQTHVIFQSSNEKTSNIPNPNKPSKIYSLNLGNNKITKLTHSYTYNWQQGSRIIWKDNNTFLFNDYDSFSNSYISKEFDIIKNKVINEYESPIQVGFVENKYYSISYEKLMHTRPDYGYFNKKSKLTDLINNESNDGIFEFDMDTHQKKLLINYSQLRNLTEVINPICWINHLMLNPSKNKLIFLFRWQETKRNHILISLDIKTNKCKIIYRSKVISHYNWIDDNRIICFMEYKTVKGYYVINLNSGEIKESKDFDPLTNLDGHPSISGDIFVTDTYPNKRGIQKLLIKDSFKSKIYDFYHPLKYNKQTRCDLHPSIKEDLIFFNSVHSGKRKSYFNFMKNL